MTEKYPPKEYWPQSITKTKQNKQTDYDAASFHRFSTHNDVVTASVSVSVNDRHSVF
jgi:hypothetical protein